MDPTATTPPASAVVSGTLDVLQQAGMNILWVLITIAACIIAAWVLRFVISRVVRRIVSGAKSRAATDDTTAIENSPLAAVRLVQRTRTLGTILQNIVNVTLVIVALVVVVQILAPDALASLTLLTAAIGAGLGFGAQNIVKDVLNGIFIVAEDQVGIGDVVDVGLATGVVEYVSVRITQIRDVNGTLWYVRNGEITRIGNMSMGWSRVIIDLAVPVDAEVGEVETAMLDAARGLAEDPQWHTRVLEKPEIWGLESINGDALVIRLVMKTRTGAKDDVARELRMRLKHAIDTLGLHLPSMNAITLSGSDEAQRVRGAHPPRTRPTPVIAERPVWRNKRVKGKKSGSRRTSGEGSADAAGGAAPPITKPSPTAAVGEAAAKPVGRPVAEPAAKPAVKPVAKPVAEPVVPPKPPLPAAPDRPDGSDS